MAPDDPPVPPPAPDAAGAEDAIALERLVPLVYDELRTIAARAMRRERAGQTIQTTALVHEAYVRLVGDRAFSFQSRAHLLGIAARSMREILIERARARGASKRGSGRERITLDEGHLPDAPRGVDMLALNEALERLARNDARQARVVELRYFGGMTVEETAAALGVAPATVKRDWTIARAWLFRELTGTR